MYSVKKNNQQGSALLVLLALILAAMAFVIIKALNSSTEAGRNEANAAVLAQAKQALIGFAATYKENPNHQSDEAYGYLPCPDVTNDGIADPPCGNQDVSVIGRLPWKTLGLPPLRDSTGECLWYAVSGRAKDLPKTTPYNFNWDAIGQFPISDADGASLVAAGTHNTPLAVIFAPGSVIAAQTHAPLGNTECGGNITASNYLDGGDLIYTGTPAAKANSIITLSTANSIRNNSNNDQGQWITSSEIFDRATNPAYVANNLLNAARNNLSFLTSAQSHPVIYDFSTTPPTESAGTVAVSVEYGRVPSAALASKDLKAWQDNLLYKYCTSGGNCLIVNGASCKGAVIFSGERLAGQTRITNANRNTWGNYLEGTVLADFQSSNTTFTSPPLVPTTYARTQRSLDVIACITPPPLGSSQTTFAGNFSDFITAGSGVTTDSTAKTVTIANAPGTSGGCFWLPNTVAFAGKTVRAYYEYQFSNSDNYATNGGVGTDRGNGITLDIVDGTQGSPSSICGLASNMGAFIESFPTSIGGVWAGKSLTIETDVHRDINPLNTLANPDDTDPVENHTAIMAYGNLAHGVAPGSNGYLTTACDGTAAGCRFTNSPSHPTWAANQFEEFPTPLLHNQRVEIRSGCNSTCATCNPASHVAPNTYVKISTWVDCTNCNDVSADNVTTPTIKRCIILDPALNSPYIALTGGFRSGAAAQGVTLSNFILRSE
ncbi:MAG: hypothetical protein PHQ60_11815 [Sideroxydans sp.]|nr:hypothetical protein [Sideroxydans sp.]